MKSEVKLPRHARAAVVQADSFDDENNSVDVIFTTGADVLRCDWMDGTYIERLLTGPENVRLDRLNAGAAFLDSHNAYELGAVLGSVVPGSARMENGQGLCRVQLSQSQRAADTVQDIRDGVIRNISVGYNVHAFTREEAADGSPAVMTATDWEPVEVTACSVPADPGAQIRAATRSAAGVEIFPCIITRAKETNMADDKKPGDTGITATDNKPPASKPAEQAPEAGKDPVDELEKQQGKVVTKDGHEIVDPGDANPVKMTKEEFERMLRNAGDAAVERERSRRNDIFDIAEKAGLRDLGAEHIRRGTKLDAFRGLLMDKMIEERAAHGGPVGGAHVAVPSLAEQTLTSEREAGAAAARAAYGKK